MKQRTLNINEYDAEEFAWEVMLDDDTRFEWANTEQPERLLRKLIRDGDVVIADLLGEEIESLAVREGMWNDVFRHPDERQEEIARWRRVAVAARAICDVLASPRPPPPRTKNADAVAYAEMALRSGLVVEVENDGPSVLTIPDGGE